MKPLTRIEMTRYPLAGWQTGYFAGHGYRPEVVGKRWFMVRHV